jgi:S1-C subfamily serine protease
VTRTHPDTVVFFRSPAARGRRPGTARLHGARSRASRYISLAVACLVLGLNTRAPGAPPDVVIRAEAERIELIERVSPSVVCIFDEARIAAGSGVLIDSEGYGLTNYHVIAGMLGTRHGLGGLADGVLYELEVLGVDVTGDVAMFRLIPPKEAFRFPYAVLGDSDEVRLGDSVLSMGNPFGLSDDYTPTVTLGIITGIHRYQRGHRGNLVYTDCLQTDAPINPGNSGGPLFDAGGRIIGINGRISVNTRGRFNVGFGYAISANQIKRFIPALRAGLLARHGTWQARVDDRPTSSGTDARVVFTNLLRPGPAHDAGIRLGDRLLSIDGIEIQSANHVASLMGTYPAGWPVRLGILRDGSPREVVIRLEPVDPRMPAPFEEDPEVNQREVKRVLEDFRRSLLVNADHQPRQANAWTVTRRHDAPHGGMPPPPERYRAVFLADQAVRLVEEHASGSAGARSEVYLPSSPTGDEAATADPPAAKEMVRATMFALHASLLEAEDEVDASGLVHVGADALVETDDTARHGTDPPLLEVIQLPITRDAIAAFAFDAESAYLVRIVARDAAAGVEITIRVGDYRDVGGAIRPCRIEVTGGGYAYTDTLSDWEWSS